MYDIIKWITVNIFGEASMLIGLIVMAGLIAQKKALQEIITGTVKAILGFLIIGAGANTIVDALLAFEPIWAYVFGLQQTSLTGIIGQQGFIARYGSAVTLAMALGFALNLLLARFTRFKYIYLTGHMMFWTTTVFAGVVVNANPNISSPHLTVILSLIMGVYWTVQPALTQPYVRKITGNDNIALGHTSASVALIGAASGKLFATNSVSCEEIEISARFGVLRDSNMVTALTMVLLFFVGTFLLQLKGGEKGQEILAASGELSFYIYALKQSLLFTGGIAVVLLGVRMFIGEIVPAFNGIANKMVPGAKPALDCPILFNYAQNAVVIGFLGAFAGALLWLWLIGYTTGYVYVPSMIVLFFHAGTAGVFGNVTGGYKGALTAGFLTATVVAIGQYVCVTVLIGDTIPDTALWAGDSDMFILAPLVAFLAHLFAF